MSDQWHVGTRRPELGAQRMAGHVHVAAPSITLSGGARRPELLEVLVVLAYGAGAALGVRVAWRRLCRRYGL